MTTSRRQETDDRQPRTLGPVLFAAVLVLLMAYVLWGAADFADRASYGPMIFGSAGLILAIATLVKEVKAVTSRQENTDQARADANAIRLGKPEFRAIGWTASCIASFLLLGLVVAVPITLIIIMRLYAKESWETSAIMTVVGSILFYVVFVEVLNVIPYPGYLSPNIQFL